MYEVEAERGMDCVEDLWCPGIFSFNLVRGKNAVMIFSVNAPLKKPSSIARRLASLERTRRGAQPKNVKEALRKSIDNYIVKRGKGLTVIAGYPWFTDWGRDTFISLRGIISAGRIKEAGIILKEWAGKESEGMLPNHFPDLGEEPQYNSVDASLWYVIVVGEYLAKTNYKDAEKFYPTLTAIMRGYRDGTRFGIKKTEDGLLFAGESGTQLTWMDAKVDGICFTPRIGKPVEIEALWLNSIRTMLTIDKKVSSKLSIPKPELTLWERIFTIGLDTFRKRFWNEKKNSLFDVIDGPDGDDDSIRPNQIIALALPHPLVNKERMKSVLNTVEKTLLTPLGLRSLAPEEKNYTGRYTGNRKERDAAYHNGTVWPWLTGAFIEAWLKVHTGKDSRKEVVKFLDGIGNHIMSFGLGHVSEIADADAPHEPKGCPFQAWSVAELLRIYDGILIKK
ncbi:TPA: hypothetical protein DEF17_07330 [bacterium]|nr:hypothetical protein [bacterium]